MEYLLTFTDQINAWIILLTAIFFSSVGTTSLKFFSQNKKIYALAGVVVGYGLFLFLITLVLKRIDMSIGYAVWAGLSTVLMTLSGVIFFKESLNGVKLISLTLIIGGVIGLNLL